MGLPWKVTVCDNLKRVLPHASASLTAGRRLWRVQEVCTSVKRNPDGISSNMLTTSLPAHPPRSSNRPPNLPPRVVPVPDDISSSTGMRDPDNDRSFKFGSCAIISRICTRVTTLVSMVKAVTDCGNVQNEGVRDNGRPPDPSRDILSTFGNHGVYSRNCSGTQYAPLIQKPKSLTWRAGLSSGTGNALNHLSTVSEVKMTVRKRSRRHD